MSCRLERGLSRGAVEPSLSLTPKSFRDNEAASSRPTSPGSGKSTSGKGTASCSDTSTVRRIEIVPHLCVRLPTEKSMVHAEAEVSERGGSAMSNGTCRAKKANSCLSRPFYPLQVVLQAPPSGCYPRGVSQVWLAVGVWVGSQHSWQRKHVTVAAGPLPAENEGRAGRNSFSKNHGEKKDIVLTQYHAS